MSTGQTAVQNLAFVPVDTGKVPKGGGKALPVTYDFSLNSSYITDFTALKATGKIAEIQSIFIDNSNNNQAVVVTMTGVNQQVAIPAQYQGIIPVFVPDAPKFTVSSQGNGLCTVVYSNTPAQTSIWPTVQTAVNVTGTINTADTVLDATVSGNRVQTTSKGAPITYVDHSGTIAAGGTSQTLLAANPNRIGFIVMNVDETNLEELGINLTGGAAAIGTAGTLTLAASGGAGYPGGSFQGGGTGQINIVGATAGHKFTCVEW